MVEKIKLDRPKLIYTGRAWHEVTVSNGQHGSETKEVETFRKSEELVYHECIDMRLNFLIYLYAYVILILGEKEEYGNLFYLLAVK